uniref:Uncharacterized protein n=1 Tax=Romanomermis culicivorax TaxID=13658 RepID=A0A915ILS3_ROMCU
MICCEKRTGALYLAATMVAIIRGLGRIAGVAKKMGGSIVGAVGGNVVVGITTSIAAGWMGVDSSIGARARFEISSSISFKKSVICVAVPVISDGAVGVGRADTSVDGPFMDFTCSWISS